MLLDRDEVINFYALFHARRMVISNTLVNALSTNRIPYTIRKICMKSKDLQKNTTRRPRVLGVQSSVTKSSGLYTRYRCLFSAIVIMYYPRRWFRALLISFLSFSRCFFVKTRVCVLCFIPLTSFFSSALQIVELFVIILLPNIYSISEYFSFLLSPRDNMSAFSWLTDAITVEQNRPCQT